MALYALDSEGVISAVEAKNQGNYRCIECKGPMQVRQGQKRRHFYHVKTTPSCRLYSKSEDHLLLQLQIEHLFPSKAISLEQPFLPIGRVADACCERNKIVFEIQCSLLTESEAKSRVIDYKSIGYDVVWLLDDRIYNRRILRPAELFLRSCICYYIRYRRTSESLFYDQLEIFQGNKRARKSVPLSIFLTTSQEIPNILPQENIPQQIIQRSALWSLYFKGDLIYKALLSQKIRPVAISLLNWVIIEKQYPAIPQKRITENIFFRNASCILLKILETILYYS